MTNVNFVNDMGIWPDDYARQIEFWNRMKTLLTQANAQIVDSVGLTVTLRQATEPTQIEWETAWTSQTGLPTPIPPSARLLWFNTGENLFGGVYGTVIGGTTVYPRSNRYPIGAVAYEGSAYKTDRVTLSTVIGAALTNYPALTFTLPTICDLDLQASLYVKLNSGTGTWGVDFLLDGVKVGTQYRGIPTNHGLYNAHSSGQLGARILISDVAAGVHTVQMIFGVTNSPVSPPSLIIGGVSGADSYGQRSLIVRGVAK